MPLREDLSRRLATVVPKDVQPGYAQDLGTEASGPIPTFPFELVDEVLGYLHPDEHAPVKAEASSAGWRSRQGTSSVKDSSPTSPKRDLLACSTVCRLWNGVARAHVFRDVAFVVHAPHVRKAYKTFADYARFLLAFPAAAGAIRALRLDFPDQYKGRAPQEVPSRALVAFLARMPKLERLHLRNVHLARAPDAYTPELQFALAELKVEYNDGPEPSQVVVDDTAAMLTSGLFSRADTLHLSSCSVRSVGEAPHRAPDAPPSVLAVNRLVVERASSGSGLLAALRTTRCLERLRALEVAIVAAPSSDDMLKAPSFIALVAPHLEHVTVRLQRTMSACGAPVLDVSSFAQLRTLTLVIALGQHAHASSHALQHVLLSYPLRQFSRAAHPHLRTLRIRLALDPPANPFATPPHPVAGRTTPGGRSIQTSARLSWMASVRGRLDEVDRRLVDIVERCDLQTVVVECEAKADAHANTLLPKLFPMLVSLGQLDLRLVTFS